MIEIHSLVKSYDGFRAADGVTFTVAPGEIVGLVGPNGAGKTTTLRCLAGIIPPTEGRISVVGHDLETDGVEAKRNLAFVPDEPHLFDHLTSWDYLMLVGRLYGVAGAEARAGALLDQFQLGDRRLSFPAELSRGMKQKLMITAALLHQPKALVLDEPLTGLDPRAMRQMKDVIVQSAAEGAAVLVSSHMLHLVQEICRRIVIIHRGKVRLQGTLAEIRGGLGGLHAESDLEQVFLAATEEETSEDAPA